MGNILFYYLAKYATKVVIVHHYFGHMILFHQNHHGFDELEVRVALMSSLHTFLPVNYF